MRIRLIYTSRTTIPVNAELIGSVLDSSQRNNSTRHITGMLCFKDDLWLQCLEGEREQVNEIYRRIAADPRHENATILNYDEIEFRSFPGWSMGYLGLASESLKILARFKQAEVFAPDKLSGKDAYRLLLDLKENLSTQTTSV